MWQQRKSGANQYKADEREAGNINIENNVGKIEEEIDIEQNITLPM